MFEKKEVRTKNLIIRMSEEEMQVLHEMAGFVGMKVSDFVRELIQREQVSIEKFKNPRKVESVQRIVVDHHWCGYCIRDTDFCRSETKGEKRLYCRECGKYEDYC